MHYVSSYMDLVPVTASFRTEFSPPTRAAYKASHMSGLTYDQYVANTRAAWERVDAYYAELDSIVVKIRELVAVEPRTEGQLYFDLRDHTGENIHRALSRMVGNRCGAVTDGELFIVGYRAGSEVYGLRGSEGCNA